MCDPLCAGGPSSGTACPPRFEFLGIGLVVAVLVLITAPWGWAEWPPPLTEPRGAVLNPGEPYTLEAGVTEGTYTYQWFLGDSAVPGATNALLTLGGDRDLVAGGYRLEISSNLGSVSSATARVELNELPTVEAPETVTLNEDETLQVPFSVGDDRTDPGALVVVARSDNPYLFPRGSMKIQGEGRERVLELVPAVNQYGQCRVYLNVVDGHGGRGMRTLGVTIRPVNDPPVLASDPPLTIRPDVPFAYRVLHFDFDGGDKSQLHVPQMPDWMEFDAERSLLKGTPGRGRPDGELVVFELTDTQSASVRYEFRIYVEDEIALASLGDVAARREALVRHIWGEAGWPSGRRLNLVLPDVALVEYEGLRGEAGNLLRVDQGVYATSEGVNSAMLHFIPRTGNGRLFVYHSGHSPAGPIGEDISANNAGDAPGFVIPELLRRGFSVLAAGMPLYDGSPAPQVTSENGETVTLTSHDELFQHVERPHRFFFEPLVVALNHLEDEYGYQDVFMTGLSGGGWTTTLYAALDPRISRSFPVAGSVPIYLKINYEPLGDAEQSEPALYSIANFTELYVMGAAGFGRLQLQILNRYDDCCFFGARQEAWVGPVTRAVERLGAGQYLFHLDESHRGHKLSADALGHILRHLPPALDRLPNRTVYQAGGHQLVPLPGLSTGQLGLDGNLEVKVTVDDPSLFEVVGVETNAWDGAVALGFTPAPGRLGVTIVHVEVRGDWSETAWLQRSFRLEVQSAEGLPTLAWVSPSAGADVRVGRRVTLEVQATDPDGRVAHLDWFVNDLPLGRSTAPPWVMGWTPPTQGEYTLSVTATDDRGVQVPGPFLDVYAWNRLPDGQPLSSVRCVLSIDKEGGLRVRGPAGGEVLLERSFDMETWVCVAVLSLEAGEAEWRDGEENRHPARFYRVLQKGAERERIAPAERPSAGPRPRVR